MDFQQLVSKMQELDTAKTEAPVEVQTDECGMPPMAPSMSSPEPKDKASMSININAQGDAIEDVMALLQKMKDNDKPSVTDMPTLSIMSPGMDAPEPEGPLMPKPINKLLPDFDGDNDDKPGGEMDSDYDDDGKLDRHEKDHADEKPLLKSLDKDGDKDHDMDDHEKEKDEAWANEPDEDERDTNYQMNKLQGGMNRRKGTHPKVAGGDNPMQKVGESDLVATIKAELQKALAETKGAK